RIDFYASGACNSSGFGPGEHPIFPSVNGTTDGNGRAMFTAVVPMPAQRVITATATMTDIGTSEFSRCIRVDGGSLAADASTLHAGGTTTVAGDGLAPGSGADIT